jgi:lipid-A-disaccharide synthase
MKKIKIFLIAGEVSGDKLGSELMISLKKQATAHEIKLEFHGIGGRRMIAEGLKLTSPMEGIGLIGFFEIVPHIFKLLSTIKSTAKIIDELKPNLVITIDSWDFCSRVVARIKSRDYMKLVHYVSPTVWAYRKNRIAQVEKLYDLVLSIFPFEPEFYVGRKVQCKFVGHPLVEGISPSIIRDDDSDRKTLGVMAGSRIGEIKKLLPTFIEAIHKFLSYAENKDKFLVVFPAVNYAISKEIKSFQPLMQFESLVLDTSKLEEQDIVSMLKQFDLALVKSGTSSLELTLAKVPMVVAYKVNYFSELIARHIFQLHKNIKYVSMTNILLDEQVIEEFLQENCNASAISNGLLQLLDPNYRKKQLLKYSKVARILANKKNKKPSDIAAKNVLKLIT